MGKWIFGLCFAPWRDDTTSFFILFLVWEEAGRQQFLVPGALQSVMSGGKKIKKLYMLFLPAWAHVKRRKASPFYHPLACSDRVYCSKRQVEHSLFEGGFVIAAHSSSCAFYGGYALPVLYLSAYFLKVCKRLITLGYPFYLCSFCHHVLSAYRYNLVWEILPLHMNLQFYKHASKMPKAGKYVHETAMFCAE